VKYLTRWLRTFHIYEPAKRLEEALRPLTPGQNRQRRSTLELYGQFLRPGDLAFDIGANIGNRTDILLQLGARVVAVEPQAACVARLNRKYGTNPHVVVVAKALGSQAGIAPMMVSEAHTISSLSTRWVDAVRSSGRFGDHAWERREQVTVTTLDDLVAEFGLPAFCKIDVEGFESEVLSGLSSPIRVLSFEFTPELAEAGFACIDRLATLGDVEFNYDIGESMHLQLANWIGPEETKARLQALEPNLFSDIYARFA
jgi:FkbM family methyltransferase